MKMKYTIHGGIGATYSFDTLQEAFKRMHYWFESNLVSERECEEFIIQIFHQIPEGDYNEIINKLSS